MKNLAKLLLYFTLNFTIVFIVAASIRLLSLQVEWARHIPQRSETFLNLLTSAASWAVSMASYLSIVLTLSYAVRSRYSSFITVIITFILCVSFNYGLSTAVHKLKTMPASPMENIELGERGLILSNTLNRNETAVILLNGMAQPRGPGVLAAPGRPLSFYESTSHINFIIPPVPFGNNSPWFVDSIRIELELNAERVQNLLNAGIIPYITYVSSLVFLLCSFGFLFKISVWPLANLFVGILVFRGILSIETFLNSSEIRIMLESLAGNILPSAMIVPVIFFVFGMLIYIYSILVYISRRRGIDDI